MHCSKASTRTVMSKNTNKFQYFWWFSKNWLFKMTSIIETSIRKSKFSIVNVISNRISNLNKSKHKNVIVADIIACILSFMKSYMIEITINSFSALIWIQIKKMIAEKKIHEIKIFRFFVLHHVNLKQHN